jgi:UDP-N-acetylglucosamine 2-epimerase (non-hydrolysing)
LLTFVLGTSAEAIKIAPLVLGLEKSQSSFLLLSTCQQGSFAQDTLADFGILSRASTLGKPSPPIRSIFQALHWFFKKLIRIIFFERKRTYMPNDQKSAIVVHGDTLSTLLGTLIGLRFRVPIIHIEAGLRSNNNLHPFPEELVRKFVSRYSSLNFAPTKKSVDNLSNARGLVVNTDGNTAIDSLRYVQGLSATITSEPYCLVLLHRTELLRSRAVFSQTLIELGAIAKNIKVIFVRDHASQDFGEEISESFPNLVIIGKLDYFLFQEYLQNAQFVITDSGGLQEECAIFGKPCLIHRLATERDDGLGSNAILSYWRKDSLTEFYTRYESYSQASLGFQKSPVQIILKELARQNLI